MKKVAVPIALCMAVAVLEGFDIQAMGVAAPRLAPDQTGTVWVEAFGGGFNVASSGTRCCVSLLMSR